MSDPGNLIVNESSTLKSEKFKIINPDEFTNGHFPKTGKHLQLWESFGDEKKYLGL